MTWMTSYLSKMGLHIDGSYLAPFRLQDSVEIGCTAFLIVKIIISISLFLYWLRNHEEFATLKLKILVFCIIVLGILWQVNQFLYLYVDEGVVTHWIHGYLATILMMTHFWLQLEITRGFSGVKSIFTESNLTYIGIGFTIFWFITTGSYWAMIPTIGQPAPPYVSYWFDIGYPLFWITVIGYDTFQSIYIILALYKVMQRKAKLLNQHELFTVQDIPTETVIVVTGFKKLWILTSIAIFIDWTNVALNLYSFRAEGVKLQTILSVFSGTIGFSHADLVGFLLSITRRVKIRASAKPITERMTSPLPTSGNTNTSLRSL